MNKKTAGLFIHKHPQAFDSLLIVSLAVLLLLIWSLFEDVGHLHMSTPMLTDEVVYTTTARNLLATGELDCNIIYLSTLDQVFTKNTFYMPGYPAILALFFWLFGDGSFVAILPSLISYVGGAWLVYLIGSMLFDRRSGWAASLLFLAFPTNLFFSFTAMTEMVLAFMSLLAFYVFLRLKPGRRWILGPFLVAGVFLVRETAALLAIFFGLFMLLSGIKKYWKETLLFFLLSFGLFALIYVSPLSSGRFPPPPFSQLVYNDLSSGKDLFSIADFLHLLLGIGRQNLQAISFPVAKDILTIAAVMGISILGVLYGLAQKRSLNYYASVLILVLLIIASFFFLYTLENFRGLRMFMFVIAFPLIGLGSIFAAGGDLLRKKLRPAPWIVLALFLLSCVQQTSYLFSVLMPPGQTAYEQQTVQLIEAVGHDDRQVLVAPLNFAVTYVDEHYPVKFAFVPASQAAFELLNEKYSIGTLIYPVSDAEPEPGYLARMREYGFTPGETIQFDGSTYLVFKR